jgi:Fe-S-cluster-containing hydrogenase component 2
MQAIAVGDDDIARVNETLCIGCGVCKPTCSTGAIALEQREKVEPPPDLETFFMTRYKAEVTD